MMSLFVGLRSIASNYCIYTTLQYYKQLTINKLKYDNMKKTKLILTSILLAYLLTSCGARKVNKQTLKEDIKTETSVLSNEKSKDSSIIETNETISNKLNFELKTNEFNFEPLDNSKPFFIGGKEYQNVKVVSKESTTKITEEFNLFRKKVEQRLLEMKKTIETLTEENKSLQSSNKQVEQEPMNLGGVVYPFMWLIIVLIILIITAYILWNKFKKELITNN